MKSRIGCTTFTWNKVPPRSCQQSEHTGLMDITTQMMTELVINEASDCPLESFSFVTNILQNYVSSPQNSWLMLHIETKCKNKEISLLFTISHIRVDR